MDGVNGTREEGFVSISDSILRYEVVFRDFSFSYDLYHGVVIYDDGITQQTMPYHEIRNIRDHGYTLTDMDFLVDENNSVFIRKQLDHSITIEFNGQDYDLAAKIELRRNLGTAPCIVESEVLDEGKDILQSGIFGAMSEVYYQSWIKVRQTWSDGKVTEETYINDCAVQVELNSESKKYKVLPDVNIIREKAVIVPGETEETAEGSPTEYIRSLVCHQSYVITYNYFTLTYEFKDMIPVYDDNVTRYEMPHYRFEEFRDSFRLSAPADDVVNGKPVWGYIFYSEMAFKFGDVESAFDEDISVYVRK